MLEAIGLTKCYASLPAVSQVSFTVRPGEILGYLGPNGSGKSTTVKMITGLMEPTRGKVLFHGNNIKDDLPAYKKVLGYVPEEALLYPYMTGWEYLEFVGILRGMDQKQLRKRADALLELFLLFPFRHATIASYSKGMRQRILLIAALMHDPEILVFDEPLSGLDVTSAMIFRKVVKSLSEQGKIILYCSHVLEVVEKLCSHLLILSKGTVAAHGSVSEVSRMTGLATLEDSFSHLVKEQESGGRQRITGVPHFARSGDRVQEISAGAGVLEHVSTGLRQSVGSVAFAASVAKLSFVGLLVVGIVSGELRAKWIATFLVLGVLVWFGLPYLTRGSDFVTSALAVIDVALVLAVYKGDVRIP